MSSLARAALVLALGALALTVGTLLALMTIAAGLAVGLLVAARALLRFAARFRRGCRSFGGRGRNCDRLARCRGLGRCRRLLRTRAAWTMRPTLGTTGRPPDFDEGVFGRRSCWRGICRNCFGIRRFRWRNFGWRSFNWRGFDRRGLDRSFAGLRHQFGIRQQRHR
jgi:hypothetical protein